MSDIKKIKTREEAKEIITNSLEQNDLDVVAMANDILANSDCICGGKSGIDVRNYGGAPADVRISKTCGEGDDRYYTIQEEDAERWSRCVWREVKIEILGGQTITHTVAINTSSNYFIIRNGQFDELP